MQSRPVFQASGMIPGSRWPHWMALPDCIPTVSPRFKTRPTTTGGLYLLSVLADKPRPWTAFFTCTICLCYPNGRHWFFNGRCDGEIIPEERGTNGFGYDPIFQMAGLTKTMAELSDTEKNRISHRARALQNTRPVLERLIRMGK